MSKKSTGEKAPIKDRIAKARRENRTQQALELANTLYKYERTEAHRDLLGHVTLERGFDLQATGKPQEAAVVFNNALDLGGTPEFLAKVLQAMATCGAGAQATSALDKLPDADARQKVLGHIADAAVAQGLKGKASLPENLHAPFDLILHAFRHYENAQDEDARTALQGIGLQSPFLEWKVLLRGLLAYQANDDARALENWQRLDATRLPARCCALLRSGIDPAFLKAQPVPAQQALRSKLMQLQGMTFVPALQDLRELIQKDNLAAAFRKTEGILPDLRRDYPDLATRLSQIFVWAIIDHGQPEDLERYLRVFGSPAEDPMIERVQGLALESRGLWKDAHKAWQGFIKHVAVSPDQWPVEIGKRVQAMIWARMAENALHGPMHKGRASNPFLDAFAEPDKALKPSAEQCLENAIKLAPDRLDTYRNLLTVYINDDNFAKAKKTAAELLKRFPDDSETLATLAQLHTEEQEYKKALECLDRAIQANPLDRKHAAAKGLLHQRFGVQLTLEGKFDEARLQYEKAFAAWEGPKSSLLCRWAICETKAGNRARADELIAQALATPNCRLAVRYALVGESVRAKLVPAEKKRIAADLKAAFAETPTPAEIVFLLSSAANQRLIHEESFHGQKSQEKTILKFLDTVDFESFDEKNLEGLVEFLKLLEARKPWLACLTFARRRYLKNVHIRISFVDYYLSEETDDPKTHLAREHLDAARTLIEAMPRGEQQQQYLDGIQKREEVLTAMQAHGRGMMDVFDHLFGGFEGDEDEDDFAYDEEENEFF